LLKASIDSDHFPDSQIRAGKSKSHLTRTISLLIHSHLLNTLPQHIAFPCGDGCLEGVGEAYGQWRYGAAMRRVHMTGNMETGFEMLKKRPG